ncbi:MAG: hypothetical protein BGO86_10440 [Chryseobacterium sp. 36-9]|nr:MAG: hypothetical protein BGO86_10440 [Chryseobacterium sp. 36-9]
MKNLTTLFLSVLFIVSCNNGTTKNTVEDHTKISDTEQEFMKKLDGEWAVTNAWSDSILTFSNTRNKNFKQEIFPSYNTIIFHPKDKTIAVNTYGEFGDGMSAIQDLKISNSKWNVENNVLNLKFDYSDYSGQHHLENKYSIDRTEQQLILKKVK